MFDFNDSFAPRGAVAKRRSKRQGVLSAMAFVLASSFNIGASAAPNTFQVGTDTIHDTFANNSFDTFTLAPAFVDTPAIFVLGNVAGGNSCEVRLQNIGLTSFDAVCAEDSSWDGQHIAVPLQYAAITEGVKTIPTNNGGSVTFEVGCVDTNRVQHNCTTGCDVESYEPISFSAGFASPPVVIANIQTVANATLGAPPANPIEPMLSVAVDNITNGGFDLALDLNKEDNVGTLNNERVCWLAVEETSSCDLAGSDDTLNFSSIGGPASVAFEAIITPDNIDGWDNQCNNTEEATFTPGCFTSTPVAIATKRGRQEPEGWLRYCTLNTGELRLTIDEQRVAGQNRQHVDETASVIAFGSSFTTPVTLSSFSSKLQGGRKLNFEWQTESESFNIGFHLWAEIDGEWVQLNKRMIASATDSLAGSQTYKKRIRVERDQLEKATAFGLSSFDSSGYEEFFGPFNLGEEYGEEAAFKPIDWSAIRQEYSESMQSAGYVYTHGRWLPATSKRVRRAQGRDYQLGREVVSMSLAQAGIHRVSYADLQNAGMSFLGVDVNHLALTYKGKAVPRIIDTDDAFFNDGDSVIFFAPELAKEDAIYTSDSLYRLQRDPSRVVNATIEDATPSAAHTTSSSYLKEYRQGQNALYVATSTSGDPWMDRKIFALGGTAQTLYTFEVGDDVVEQDSHLSVNLLGGIDFPSVAELNPDHHVVVRVNDVIVADHRFDGFSDYLIDVEIPQGVIERGTNFVQIILPGDTGQLADIVYVDELSVKVPQHSRLLADKLIISAQPGETQYRVQDSGKVSRIFAYQDGGNFAELIGAEVSDQGTVFRGFELAEGADTFYAVMSPSGYAKPSSMSVETPLNIVQGLNADYLIVAHPMFINDDLERFAQAKRDAGLKTEIINWLHVVETYGYGMPTPYALQNFFKRAHQESAFQYALIVGGHSYDYNDHLGLGNVNFIPTMYQTVAKNFVYAPTDALLVDVNDTGLPDIAIGRWPVRNTQDLQNIVTKTLQWQAASARYASNTLLVADVTDSARGQNFAEQLHEVAVAGGVAVDQTNVHKVYLDDYLARATDRPIEEAKADLLGNFSLGAPGVGMTIYNGHSSSSRWTFRNLLNVNDIVDFANSDAPTLILPLACYTTLYESPTVDTLAHQLLFANEGGAVALTGAAYLSEYRENAQFAKQILKGLNNSNVSIGQAILEHKNTLMPWNDMVTNWSYLGDPSLSFIAN